MTKRSARKNTRTTYRDAATGEFITEKSAKRRSPTTVIKERLPLQGRADTGRRKKKAVARKVKSLHKTGRISRRKASATAMSLRDSKSGMFIGDGEVSAKSTASGRKAIAFRVKETHRGSKRSKTAHKSRK